MKMSWFFQFMFRIKNLNTMGLLLLNDDDKSRYVYIKDFDRFMFHKTKNGFAEVAYSVLVVQVC